ncbi:UNC-like C-terminal-domain-containing protein [Lophiotrema nucula]|uniref:UNC-like C-terminal-domain-containing protein n=1 Tax=Lophiotrema nucula TaxID=690887 RepID=A0A6A5Z9C0_9PLEO|nr:UNC-like C-terminal-domain-containing protein [Lophiotrema nucula]
MPTIGAQLRKWTTFLLLCSIPTLAHSTNETAPTESSTNVSSSASSTPTKSASAPPSSASKPSSASYHESACPFRTINYITHTLPQQCLKTAWSAPSQEATAGAPGSVDEASPTPPIVIPWAAKDEDGKIEKKQQDGGALVEPHSSSEQEAVPLPTSTDPTGTQPELEIETDSPLDNANFLSFEDWKKKNLERVGQSPENVGQGRAAPSNSNARRRPVNINALDSLGDEAEIELDFGGFGNAQGGDTDSRSPTATQEQSDATTPSEVGESATPSSWALSKDAGKTCKERFNYASFDCAATVLKTNSKAKSLSSILVENKDSYMLNECSAQNKFVIVELCDDILVDTLVLANYEFFSSMFRHFRVSVSDRYPVKMDRWRTLGTFEARNSRDIQPFLVSEPQIWARYLRIEFLTQYGNEFYCPISLLRVHGTTMMEQFRREEEDARGEDDYGEPIEEGEGEPVKEAQQVPEDIAAMPSGNIGVNPEKDAEATPEPSPTTDHSSARADPKTTPQESSSGELYSEKTLSAEVQTPEDGSGVTSSQEVGVGNESPTPPTSTSSPSSKGKVNGRTETTEVDKGKVTESPSTTTAESASSQASLNQIQSNSSTATAIESEKATSGSSTSDAPGTSTSTIPAKAASNSTVNGQSQQRASQTQQNPATPSTQESFFKSIHKRLQQLEANSTLSLQYIEEQSRILRDAFIKVEKRQLSKTETFLNHLNSTVMQELKGYRNMYDQLWQSTILELEGMKERQKAEIGEIGARLSLVADELVWQKRMAVVQSTLLLLCLGLVLFVRSGTVSGQLDIPIVQQLGSRASRFFDSPPGSPEAPAGPRRRRTFRNMWRSDTSALSERSGHLSDGANEHAISDADTDGRRSPVSIQRRPPTPSDIGSSPPQPNGAAPLSSKSMDTGLLTPSELDDEVRRLQALATQSGPATPLGTRDSRPSWEEVERAVDLLKAEEQGQGKELAERLQRELRRKRSPLRRAESYDGIVDDSPGDDDVDGLFVAG